MSETSRAGLTHGLIIRPEPLNRILDGVKTWEVRGHRTNLRGLIALIEGGSGHIIGVAELVDVVGPLSAASMSRSSDRTGYDRLPVTYREYFAWVLCAPRRLAKPVRYDHPNGAVVWVRLDKEVAATILSQQEAFPKLGFPTHGKKGGAAGSKVGL